MMDAQQYATAMWQTPPRNLTIATDAVHVWRVDIPALLGRVPRLEATLSATERARAARFRFLEHRTRFIVTHGVLRDILGRYLDIPAAQLELTTNAYGKPILVAPEHAWLQFNLSHSGDLILFAITRDRPVGIDVEQLIPPDNFTRLVEQFFSPNEYAALLALPEEKRAAAFFAGWTRKEAYVKALGMGVSLPLDQFDVIMDPDAPARLLADRRHPQYPETWTLLSFIPAPGYTAALAVEILHPTMTFYHWYPRI